MIAVPVPSLHRYTALAPGEEDPGLFIYELVPLSGNKALRGVCKLELCTDTHLAQADNKVLSFEIKSQKQIQYPWSIDTDTESGIENKNLESQPWHNQKTQSTIDRCNSGKQNTTKPQNPHPLLYVQCRKIPL